MTTAMDAKLLSMQAVNPPHREIYHALIVLCYFFFKINSFEKFF